MTHQPPLSAFARRTSPPPISELMRRALANPGLVSLAAGFVDPVTLPVHATQEAAAAILADPIEGRRALQYGSTQGDHRLRDQIIGRLEREEGVEPGSYSRFSSRTVVTTGSQQLLYLLAEALLDPGDIVLVEAPTYFVYLGLLESRGAVAIGVEIDEGGLRLDSLESTLEGLEAEGKLSRVKLIYTVCEHSNPTGLSLAADRRGPLLDLAQRWSERVGRPIYLLEDSAYRGLTFTDHAPPSVWALDAAAGRGETVIHARTFSKSYAPGLRLGYGVLPESLVGPILAIKGNQDFGSPNLAQLIVHRALVDGGYEAQVAKLVAAYRTKRDVMLSALDEHLGPMAGDGTISWTRPEGGMYVWLTLPEGLATGWGSPFFERCMEEGVLYVPGAYAYPSGPEAAPAPANHARLCYGVPSVAELTEGVRRLAAALNHCLDPVACAAE